MFDINSRENRRHSSKLIPYSYYKSNIPRYFSNVPLHWHSEFEINYVLKGCGEFICGDNKFISEKGDIIIIPPNLLHAVYPIEGVEYVYDTFVFNQEMLGSLDNDRSAAECIRPIINGKFNVNSRITPEHQYYDELKTTTENIISCAKGNTALLDMLLKSELLRLFWLLENCGDIYHKKGTDPDRSDIMRPALEYISENFRENISVSQLADIVHLSRSYFMHSFKRVAGIGAIEYIMQLRIKAACELLSSTDKTVAEIAFECGFSNLSNFNRQFKNISNCTPNEYRKKVRHDRHSCHNPPY